MLSGVAAAAKRRILIADDHQLLAEGIAGLLASEYEIIGLVFDGRALVAEAERLRPSAVVLDVSMPELNGIEAATQIHRRLPGTRLVFVSQQSDPMYVRAAFRAGALAYVLKESAASELRTALRRALMGATFISPALEAKTSYTPTREMHRPFHGLTARQREVLQLTAEGKTAREISAKLNITTKTVEFHKKALMDRTGLRTVAELTRYAVGNGIVSPYQ